jgi:hypothetical protein
MDISILGGFQVSVVFTQDKMGKTSADRARCLSSEQILLNLFQILSRTLLLYTLSHKFES